MSRNRAEKQHEESFAPVGTGTRVVKLAATLWVAAAMLLAGVAGVRAKGNGQGVVIRVVSKRPDVVSGGNAMVQVSLPRHALATDVRMTLNGKDVSGEFHPQTDGSLMSLADGMVPGKIASPSS